VSIKNDLRLFFLGGRQETVLVRIQAQSNIFYCFCPFVISIYSNMSIGSIAAPEIHREQDFWVRHVIPLNKATYESKDDGFPNASMRVFNARSRAHQA
jgi:hypothetical protein